MLDSRIRVGDIRSHLAAEQISPEKFASQVQLSHMTIRRWLKRKSTDTIPEKYHTLLAPVLRQEPEAFSAERLLTEIEKSGKEFSDIETLDRDLKEKLKTSRVDRIFIGYCKELLGALKSPRTSMSAKAIAAGALLYFISPIDLIPDQTPVIGYLDDLAVLSLAVQSITAEKRGKPESQNYRMQR